MYKNKVLAEPHDLRFYSLSTSLHCEATDGLSTFIIHRMPDNHPPTHRWLARLS